MNVAAQSCSAMLLTSPSISVTAVTFHDEMGPSDLSLSGSAHQRARAACRLPLSGNAWACAVAAAESGAARFRCSVKLIVRVERRSSAELGDALA